MVHLTIGLRGDCTLLVFIDDATSKILWLEFAKSENQIDVMRATKHYFLCHGRPHEFYVDFGSVSSANANNRERDKITQWKRAIEVELGVKIRFTRSPEAKGRVERANGTLQDRLIKEMRLLGISSIESANNFVGEYIIKHNQRFAVEPSKKGNAGRSINDYKLDNIFCIKEERALAKDYVISYKTRLFQIDGRSYAIRPKNVITVNTHLDDSIRLSISKTNLEFIEIYSRPKLINREKKLKVDKLPLKPSRNSRLWASGRTPAPREHASLEKVAGDRGHINVSKSRTFHFAQNRSFSLCFDMNQNKSLLI